MSAELAQRLAGEWLVVSNWGQPVDPQAPRTVVFEEATVAGQVGVNRFSGRYTPDDAVIERMCSHAARRYGPRPG